MRAVPGRRPIYEAREHALDLLEAAALACGADRVLGTDLFVRELGGGLVEFMAIGTAAKRTDGIATESDALPAPAVALHRTTFRASTDAMLAGRPVRE